MTGRTYRNLAAAVAVIALIIGGAAGVSAQKKGGTIRVGNLGEPPTLDAHWTTASITETLTNHIYEGLLTLDDENKPIPMLAETMPTVSPDGLTYTFKLRHGIKFHNGKEMTSDDVVASLTRWGKQSISGTALFTSVAEGGLRGVDKYTVELKLKEKVAIVQINLAVANNFAAIYPKEIAEKFPPAEKVTEYVGTGPFKLVEWKPDQYIKMVRFDDYKPRSEKPNGYGGAKIVYVDEIRWIPVPDVATRVAQMETGELELADDLNADAYDRLKASANARPIISKLYYWLVAVLNKKEGLMTNQKLRQAWQAALDIEPIMKTVAAGRSEFYRMDYNLIHQEMGAWHVKMQGLPWNEHNKEKAKKLLQEAGYKGEPIRFLTTKEYAWMYNYALVTKQQLEELGVTVDLQVVDWATLVQRRNNPQMYDIFTTGMSFVPDPTQHPYLRCDWPGWTCDEEIQKRMDVIRKEPDPAKRKAQWEEVQKRFYEYVPAIRYGDIFGFRAMQTSVKGFNENMSFYRFYNVWLEK
jgi:peptide/nickel transport system substrate-binding protein